MQNKPGIRLVATDIDGTLADDQGEINPFTLRILQQLLERDIAVALVTGLNPWPVRRYVQQIGHGIRAICLNGIFHIEEDELQPGSFVDFDVAVAAAQLIRAHGYVSLVYGADNVTRYIPGSPEAMNEVSDLIANRPYQPYRAVNTFDALFGVRPAQVSVCDTGERAARLYPLLNDAVGDRAYVVYQPGHRAWVEVNHPQARKDVALLKLAERIGVSAEEILYFGDNLNDLPVFEAITFPVAVSNARPEVINLAWQTALTNNAQGVAHFLAAMFDLDSKTAN